MIGNGVATLVLARWEGELESEALRHIWPDLLNSPLTNHPSATLRERPNGAMDRGCWIRKAKIREREWETLRSFAKMPAALSSACPSTPE